MSTWPGARSVERVGARPSSGEPVTAFDDRFDELWRVAYQVAFRVLGEREEAADVAQEAVARVALRWDRVEGHAAALTARISAGRAIDAWRRRRLAGHGHASPPGGVEVPAGESAVDDRAELVAALRRLPVRQRDAVVLRYLADLSELDTAQALGCSPGTVKQHTSRGLRSLRSVLTATTGE